MYEKNSIPGIRKAKGNGYIVLIILCFIDSICWVFFQVIELLVPQQICQKRGTLDLFIEK